MASYLLDTCTALWMFEGSDRIPIAVRDILVDRAHRIFFSDVSLLEIVIKNNRGSLPLPKPPSRIIRPLVIKHDLEALPLAGEAILELEKLPANHRDPFDRLLISQARTHALVLLTPDPLIQAYDLNWYWG